MQRLKSAVWHTVNKLVIEETRHLKAAVDQSFIDSLTEVVFNQAILLGQDLENFARLDNRRLVTMDDLKMCMRRNPEVGRAVLDGADVNGS